MMVMVMVMAVMSTPREVVDVVDVHVAVPAAISVLGVVVGRRVVVAAAAAVAVAIVVIVRGSSSSIVVRDNNT